MLFLVKAVHGPARVSARESPWTASWAGRTLVAVYGTVVQYTPHLMGRDPGRPVQTRGPSHGQDGCRSSSSSSTHLLGRGPDRPLKTRGPPHGQGGAANIEPTSHGPRPGPARHILEVSARPGPPIFQNSRPGPARSAPDHRLMTSPEN